MIKEIDPVFVIYLDRLPPRWAQVLMMRSGLYNGRFYTQRAIAKEMGISAGRVEQLESGAKHRVRQFRWTDRIKRNRGREVMRGLAKP